MVWWSDWDFLFFHARTLLSSKSHLPLSPKNQANIKYIENVPVRTQFRFEKWCTGFTTGLNWTEVGCDVEKLKGMTIYILGHIIIFAYIKDLQSICGILYNFVGSGLQYLKRKYGNFHMHKWNVILLPPYFLLFALKKFFMKRNEFIFLEKYWFYMERKYFRLTIFVFLLIVPQLKY